jgi:type IV secretory pathway VirB4 component
MGNIQTKPLRPQLDNDLLFNYPTISDVLKRLTENDKQSGRNYARYTESIENATGAKNIAEILLLIYNMVDARGEGEKGVPHNKVLIDLIRDANDPFSTDLEPTPSPLISLLIVKALEHAALQFEKDNFPAFVD